MNAVLPKQFIPLQGKPILMHTIAAFFASQHKPEIIVSLNADSYDLWNDLCAKYNFKIPHRLIQGGTERFHSVKNALDLLPDESIIAVHDAVRPLISEDLIDRLFKNAKDLKAVIPVVDSRDSIRRRTSAGKTESVPRADILIVQTPQVFDGGLLKEAYNQPFNPFFTDDASVVESLGYEIHVTQGAHTNLKITYEDDLQIASLLLSKKAERF